VVKSSKTFDVQYASCGENLVTFRAQERRSYKH